MDINVLNKKFITFLFIVILLIILNNYSYAATGLESFNNAPRILIKTNPSKFDNVDITFIDYSGLDSSKIKFYSTDKSRKKRRRNN